MNNFLAGSFVDPFALIQQLAVSPGANVADFGCGSGYFSLAFGRAIGENGKVVALDILPSALSAVASRAKMEKVSNVLTKRANLEKENGSGLEPESIDWVILKDILFQNKHKEIVLQEAYRVLRPGGSLLLMEWKDENAPVGPDNSLRLSQKTVLELIQSVGFSLEKELQVGDFHYAFVLKK